MWDERTATVSSGEDVQLDYESFTVKNVKKDSIALDSNEFFAVDDNDKRMDLPIELKLGESAYIVHEDNSVKYSLKVSFTEISGKESKQSANLQSTIYEILKILHEFHLIKQKVDRSQSEEIAAALESAKADGDLEKLDTIKLNEDTSRFFWDIIAEKFQTGIYVFHDWWMSLEQLEEILLEIVGRKLKINYPSGQLSEIAFVDKDQKYVYSVSSNAKIDLSKRSSNFVWLQVMNKLFQELGVDKRFTVLYDSGTEDFGVYALVREPKLLREKLKVVIKIRLPEMRVNVKRI